MEFRAGDLELGFLPPLVFSCSFRDPSTRSWPPGSRVEGGQDEEESFLQPVDDYFVEPPEAKDEEEEEDRVSPSTSSSHTPAGVSKGEESQTWPGRGSSMGGNYQGEAE